MPFLILTLGILIVSCSNNNKRIIGEWKGGDKGEIGSLILDKTQHAVIVLGNQVMGGKDYEVNGFKSECKYEIDYSKDPIWLDIVVYESGTAQEKVRLKGIIKFITDNKIEYRVNFEGNRFDKFDPDDKENTLVFDRVSK